MSLKYEGFRVKGLGLTVRCRDVPPLLDVPESLGLGVSGFRVWGLGFQGSGFEV
jgi:hypothetical protein